MLLTKKDIIAIIPHRYPMIMIDDLLLCEQNRTVTRFKIVSESIFLKDGVFEESGLMENIAQTAAAGAGWFCREEQLPARISLIGAISKFHVHFFPAVDDTLYTTAKMVASMAGFTLIKGEVRLNEILIAEAELKVFTGPET